MHGEATVDHDFWIAETQMTYELWYEVYSWATDDDRGENKYTFANAGREGSHGSIGQAPSSKKNEPVTRVNWYDSIVWCNALSEYKGYSPVYTVNNFIVKSTTGYTPTDVVAEDTDGFRLPTRYEWELAARYKGSDSSHGAIEYPAVSGQYWTPGNFASGATGPAHSPTGVGATKAAAWYRVRWYGSGNTEKTQDVGQKPEEGNGLGVFDMSGNVWEWCFDCSNKSDRVKRGGSWLSVASYLRVGSVFSFAPSFVYESVGLRLVRTHF